MKEVYITKIAKFLPNQPVDNDEMGGILGIINGDERIKRLILRRNGIQTRYYAINRSGEITHTNAALTFEAIKGILDKDFTLQDIELLSTGTSAPDQIMPSHAAMVHGLMGANASLEINAASGNCTSGLSALKYAFMALRLGDKQNAVVTGSDVSSTLMQHNKYAADIDDKTLEKHPILAFEKEFLRWMLSDGAGAFRLENKKQPTGLNLKIEWVEGVSFANQVEACMYAGSVKTKEGKLKPWSHFSSKEWEEKDVFAVKQDVKLLDEHIVAKGVQSMRDVLQQKSLSVDEIDYFLPHISSFYFKDILAKGLDEIGIHVPEEKWFINLKEVGNIGSASIFIALADLVEKKQLKPGERILLSVPESARFNYIYALLTVA